MAVMFLLERMFEFYTLSKQTCVHAPVVLMLSDDTLNFKIKSRNSARVTDRPDFYINWELIDKGMPIGQSWYSVMDWTYQSRASPLDRKHFDEYQT